MTQNERKARYAEAIAGAASDCGSHEPANVTFARAVMAVADVELGQRAVVIKALAEKVTEVAAERDDARAEVRDLRAKVAAVEGLVNDRSRHLVRWIDGSALVDVADLHAALTSGGR